MKIFYWGPYLDHIGTIKGMLNSAYAARKYGKHEVGLLRTYKEWQEYESEDNFKAMQVLDLGISKFIPKAVIRGGYFFSRLFSILILIFSPLKLAKLIDKEKPDIIVTCLMVIPLLVAIRFSKHKPKVFSIIWGYPNFLMSRDKQEKNYLRMFEAACRKFSWKCLYKNVDYIAAVSPGTKKDIEREFPFAIGKTFVMRVPIADEKLLELAKEECKHEWFQEKEKPIVIAVARLTKQKGFDVLIKAFSEVNKKIPARLLILGEGEERECLEAIVKELKLEENVSLPGFVNNPFSYLAHADLFVLSSRWEDPCHAIIEAGYIGTPIVTTDCPSGPADFVEWGKGGAVCKVDDVESMSNAMLEMLSTDVTEKVQAAKQNAENFTLPGHYKQFAEITEI